VDGGFTGGGLMVSKICSYDGGVCRRDSCDTVLVCGDVVLCSRHRNPFGCFRHRKVV
jgi:hypothetical protein